MVGRPTKISYKCESHKGQEEIPQCCMEFIIYGENRDLGGLLGVMRGGIDFSTSQIVHILI